MTGLKKSFKIKAKDFIHAGEASISIQNLLKSMDFDAQLIRRIAICGYEGEMNVVMHGGDGQMSVEPLRVSQEPVGFAKRSSTLQQCKPSYPFHVQLLHH